MKETIRIMNNKNSNTRRAVADLFTQIPTEYLFLLGQTQIHFGLQFCILRLTPTKFSLDEMPPELQLELHDAFTELASAKIDLNLVREENKFLEDTLAEEVKAADNEVAELEREVTALR